VACANKYYGTNFVYAVPSSLLIIAPGLRTIQFLLLFPDDFFREKASKSLNFKPLFPNLKVITDVYGQSQMRANFWCFHTVGSPFCFDEFENAVMRNVDNMKNISRMRKTRISKSQ
jgi:hypothetical protein